MKRFALAMALLGTMAMAQDAATPPKLKDSVSLNLRTLQLNLANTRIQMMQAQIQYRQLQDTERTQGDAFNAAFATALKDSDIDADKFDLENGTFEVKPKEKK